MPNNHHISLLTFNPDNKEDEATDEAAVAKVVVVEVVIVVEDVAAVAVAVNNNNVITTKANIAIATVHAITPVGSVRLQERTTSGMPPLIIKWVDQLRIVNDFQGAVVIV